MELQKKYPISFGLNTYDERGKLNTTVYVENSMRLSFVNIRIVQTLYSNEIEISKKTMAFEMYQEDMAPCVSDILTYATKMKQLQDLFGK